MKLFINKIVSFLFPIFLTIVITNFFVDPGTRFFRKPIVENKIYSALLQGHNLTGIGNLDEFSFQQRLILQTDQCPEIVAVGSSRSMLIHNYYFFPHSFRNNSIPNCRISEMASFLFEYIEKGCRPDTVLIEVDPWSFDASHERGAVQNTDVSRALTALGHSPPAVPRYQKWLRKTKAGVSYVLPLVLPSYFQSSIRQLYRHDTGIVVTDQIFNTLPTRLADGSLSYQKAINTLTPSESEKLAIKDLDRPDMKSKITRSHVSHETISLFENFLKYLEERRIEIIIIDPPLHPLIWEYILQSPECREVLEWDKILKQIVKKHHILLIGSLNPKSLGMKSTDFANGFHLNQKGVTKLLKPISTCSTPNCSSK
ncbi:MAG: hypothetical protein D6679_08590 [Candidatus Hydrogenedentota bacterium]|nr:MAG: hypothetical protein D6679_08590 [Candidatus Hydrogenedentota bacterium]